MFISTPKQLSEVIQELTNWTWVDEALVKKLTDKEFGYIAAIIHSYGTENKIFNILERANKRK